MNESIDDLFRDSASKRIEVIQFMRKVIHKFAFRCWAGEEAGKREELREEEEDMRGERGKKMRE